MAERTHEQKFYYGKGCRNELSAPGKLAVHTWTVGKHMSDLEVIVGRSRQDIGRIEVKDFRPGRETDWVEVFNEERDKRVQP